MLASVGSCLLHPHHPTRAIEERKRPQETHEMILYLAHIMMCESLLPSPGRRTHSGVTLGPGGLRVQGMFCCNRLHPCYNSPSLL